MYTNMHQIPKILIASHGCVPMPMCRHVKCTKCTCPSRHSALALGIVLLMVLALHCVFNLSYRTPHLQPANDALKVAGTPTPAPDRVVQKLVDNGRVRTAEEIRIMAEKSRRRAARHRKQIGIVWDSEDVGGNESPAPLQPWLQQIDPVLGVPPLTQQYCAVDVIAQHERPWKYAFWEDVWRQTCESRHRFEATVPLAVDAVPASVRAVISAPSLGHGAEHGRVGRLKHPIPVPAVLKLRRLPAGGFIFYFPGSGSTLLCNMLLAAWENIVMSEPREPLRAVMEANHLHSKLSQRRQKAVGLLRLRGMTRNISSSVGADEALSNEGGPLQLTFVPKVLQRFKERIDELGVQVVSNDAGDGKNRCMHNNCDDRGAFYFKSRAFGISRRSYRNWFRWFLSAYPGVPWVATYRDPADTIASPARYCEEDILGEVPGSSGQVGDPSAGTARNPTAAQRRIAEACADRIAIMYRRLLELLRGPHNKVPAPPLANGAAGAARLPQRWSNVHRITLRTDFDQQGMGASVGRGPGTVATGWMLIVNYTAMPRAFFSCTSHGSGSCVSVAELLGRAPLSPQERARAADISRFYSKSIGDAPSVLPPIKHVVHAWVRELVQERVGATVRELAPYITS